MDLREDQVVQDTKETKEKKPKWIPLESNPSVLNKFINHLGVPNSWGFADCLGLSEELLSFVQKPCIAILFLFPVGSKLTVLGNPELVQDPSKSDIYFMKQLVGNACGSIAVFHAIANKLDLVKIDTSKPLHNFLEKTKTSSPAERGLELGLDETITAAHESVGKKGQTRPEDIMKSNFHFICFIEKNGKLYELDGTKEGPLNHGATTQQTFLEDAAKVIKQNWIDPNPDELYFSFITLGAAPDEMSGAGFSYQEEVTVSSSALATLVSMGFDQNKSSQALRTCNNDVETAIIQLVSQL